MDYVTTPLDIAAAGPPLPLRADTSLYTSPDPALLGIGCSRTVFAADPALTTCDRGRLRNPGVLEDGGDLEIKGDGARSGSCNSMAGGGVGCR